MYGAVVLLVSQSSPRSKPTGTGSTTGAGVTAVIAASTSALSTMCGQCSMIQRRRSLCPAIASRTSSVASVRLSCPLASAVMTERWSGGALARIESSSVRRSPSSTADRCRNGTAAVGACDASQSADAPSEAAADSHSVAFDTGRAPRGELSSAMPFSARKDATVRTASSHTWAATAVVGRSPSASISQPGRCAASRAAARSTDRSAARR